MKKVEKSNKMKRKELTKAGFVEYFQKIEII